jgi:hypothetical protein
MGNVLGDAQLLSDVVLVAHAVRQDIAVMIQSIVFSTVGEICF